MSMKSRYISVRPNNVNSDSTISFKSGFPTVSWTIPAQNGRLDPRSVRINGNLEVFKNALGDATSPVFNDDGGANQVNMDNRLGIYAMFDELIIRHDKSKQICEQIANYNRYMQTYLGVTSSQNDLMGHMNEAALIQPNSRAMFENVVANGQAAAGTTIPKSFSVYLPCGFLMGMDGMLNLMENSFGAVTVEIRLSPDSNCLFGSVGDLTNISDAFYQLSKLSLTAQVYDIEPEEMDVLRQQTTGALSFNTISSLYTTINTNSAMLQFSTGLRNLQSVFMNFCPSSHINTLTQNGLATTYPSQSNADLDLCAIKTVQFLKGGSNYPAEFTMNSNSQIPGNSTTATGVFTIGDPQLAKMLVDSVIPEKQLNRTSITPVNYGRNYTMIANGGNVDSYKQVQDGGALFGLGIRLSQFNKGISYQSEQFGCAIESDLSTDNPISVFLYFKAKAQLLWNESGVNLVQ